MCFSDQPGGRAVPSTLVPFYQGFLTLFIQGVCGAPALGGAVFWVQEGKVNGTRGRPAWRRHTEPRGAEGTERHNLGLCPRPSRSGTGRGVFPTDLRDLFPPPKPLVGESLSFLAGVPSFHPAGGPLSPQAPRWACLTLPLGSIKRVSSRCWASKGPATPDLKNIFLIVSSSTCSPFTSRVWYEEKI